MSRSSCAAVGARRLGYWIVLACTWFVLASVAVAQQPEIVVQSGHASPVNVVAFSPDGKLLASGSGEEWSFVEKNVIKLWEVSSGRELRTLVHDRPVKWIGFSPDGTKVAAKGTNDLKERVWDVASGNVLAEIAEAPEFVSRDTTTDGKIAAVIDKKNILLRDAASGQPLRTLASRTSDFQKYLFSPDSTVLACGGERFSIRLWDLRSGTLRTLVGHTDFPVVADFSPDSRLFASGGRDLVVRLWDVISGREIKKLTGHAGQNIRGMHFSADGKTLLSFDRAGFKLWDVATGRELVSGEGSHDDDFRRVVFNPRGDLLAATTEEGIKLWTAATGQELRVLPGSGSLEFSPDGNSLLANGSSRVRLWDVKSGKQLAVIDPSAQGENSRDVQFIRAVFSPDSHTLAVSEFDSRDDAWQWKLHLYDAKTGKHLRTIDEKTADPYGVVVFSPDSKQVSNEASDNKLTWDIESGKRLEDSKPAVYYSDSPNGAYRVALAAAGEITLYDGRNGLELASLIGIGETDWLVATPEGFFDGSAAAWKQIIWRFNNDTLNYVPLEAFFNEFYHPGLLQDVLTGKRPARPDAKSLSRIDRRQPSVTISEVELPAADDNAARGTRTVTLAVEVTENLEAPAQPDHSASSGARDVRLFRNGSLVKAWRGDVVAQAAKSGGKRIDADTSKAKRVRYEVSVPIVAGPNEFTAYAFNQANVKSEDAALSINGAESLRRRATLHVLAVGINQYENDRFNLRFAVSDAREFAAEIKRQQVELKNFARVDTIMLVDERATKRNLLAALHTLARNAQAEDTVVVYFAGHGIARQDQFYLLPHDLGYPDDLAQIASDGWESLLRHGVSDRELERALEQVDAAQLLLVIDACNSGQALEAEEKRRGPMNSKGLAQLAYEKGICVLTAAQSFQAAREVSKLGHGLLTYVLVDEGLKQAAADTDPHDEQITLGEWLDYATRRVPQVHLQEIARNRGVGSKREPQRPRAFYRSETHAGPLVVATASAKIPPVELTADETELATAEAGPLSVAFADNTLTGQSLPKAIKQQWQTRLEAFADDETAGFKLVSDPADADWLIQVAALERPDVLYLAPSEKLAEVPNDALLQMSPPGDDALRWLKAELERLALERASGQSPVASATGYVTAIQADDEDDRDRAILGLFHKGPAEDLKAEIVREQSGLYHTPNRTQAVLGTYGKMIERNRLLGHLPRFEHRGAMQHFDRVRRFTTVQRQGRGSGQDFVSLVGTRQAWQVVDLTGKASGGRQNEVDFEIVGIRLDQSDAIKALNADADALGYFNYLAKNKETPCVILENLVFTSYAAAQSTTVNLGATAKTSLTSDGGAAALQTQRSTFTRFTAPIVRCYQMYQVKLDQNRVVELVNVEP